MAGGKWLRRGAFIGAFVTGSAPAIASVITYTSTLPAVSVPLGQTIMNTIPVPAFNTSLGTLESTNVSIATTFTYGGSVTINSPILTSGLTQLSGTTATYDLTNYGLFQTPITSASAAYASCPCSATTFGDSGSITKTGSAASTATVPPLTGGNIPYTYTFKSAAPGSVSVNLTNTVGATVTVTDTYAPPAITPPPSLLTLAELSQSTYSNTNTSILDTTNNTLYTPVYQEVVGGFKAIAYASPDNGQLVVAVRGTATDNTLNSEKSAAADVSFGGTQPTAILTSELTDASDFIKGLKVMPQFTNSNITLTGHSLGGAIAQLIGEASGFSTIAFDAPGAQQLYQQLGPSELGLWLPLTGNANTNVRVYGDQISQIGTPIGNTFTYTAPVAITPYNTPLTEILANIPTVLTLHSINTVVNQLMAGASLVAGCTSAPCLGEPNLGQVIADAVEPTTGTCDQLLAPCVVSPAIYRYLFSIGSPHSLIAIDPQGGTDYQFTEDAGSPEFYSIDLPLLSGIGSYRVSYEIGSQWSPFTVLQAGTEYNLGFGVDGLEFQPLDNLGQQTLTSDSFLFGVSFADAGEFSGTLTVTQPNSIPEPSSLNLAALPVIIIAGLRSKHSKKARTRVQ